IGQQIAAGIAGAGVFVGAWLLQPVKGEIAGEIDRRRDRAKTGVGRNPVHRRNRLRRSRCGPQGLLALRRPYDPATAFTQACGGGRADRQALPARSFPPNQGNGAAPGRTVRRTAPTAGEQPPMSTENELFAALRSVATATITTVL